MKRTRKIREISPLLSDCYKFGHRVLYPEDTTYVYSTLTPRANSYFPYSDKMVAFGYEMFAQRWLVEHFNENFFDLDLNEVLEDFSYVVDNALEDIKGQNQHIIDLYELGYLPILIKALPEGIQVPMKVPVLTIENTHEDFAWLTNFLETLLLSETFVTSTVASMALALRTVATKYGVMTADDLGYIDYQCHDFSERGQHGNSASQLSGVAHLTSFVGSDTLQASVMAHNYYGADLEAEAVLKSVVASEHSVMQSYGTDEVETYRELISRFPNGILSLVSDTYDYFGVLTNVLPKLHDEIMARNGKLVIRPDSGKPVDIIAGVKAIDISSVIDEGTIYTGGLAMLLTEHVDELMYEDVAILVHNGDYYTIEIMVDSFDGENYHVELTSELDKYTPTPEDKGSLELLWEEFGGTINSKGYRVLDPHIGLLYGEGITVDSMEEILIRMEQKGFSAENIVFGVGAYVYAGQIFRDCFEQAVKSQLVTVNGEDRKIFKNPKTDTKNIKRSLKGKVVVVTDPNDPDNIVAIDDLPKGEVVLGDLLQPIFKDGEMLRSTPFKVIRKRLLASL